MVTMPSETDKDYSFGRFCCAVLLLLVGLAVGTAVADWINAMPTETLPPITADRTAGQERSDWELFVFILRRNMTVYVMLLLGVVSAGLVTVAVLLGNGLAVGQLIGFARVSGMSNLDIANLLLPHGVLELGTLCIAGAVGLQGIPLALRVSSLDWSSIKSLRLGTALLFGLGALAAAAAVEAFVTADIAESLRVER
ncbi:MAG: stage II sporulation protein M [Gammaproteobacteria bacterium]|nr:stage II sporulation protein M [Gammaproteobacteria bacterium]